MFSERLERLIADTKTNRNQISKATGISSGLMTEYVQGKKTPSDNLVKLADYFGVSTDYLMGRTNSPTSTISGNITGIGIVHDVSGGTIIGSNPTERNMTAEEAELLRIFNLLDVKRRHRLLEFTFSLEEEIKGVHS